MEENKFVRYDFVNGEYWKYFEFEENEDKAVCIGKSIAIFYDHKIGQVHYHGKPPLVREKVKELIDSQKKAEESLGFFLEDYRLYVFADIDVKILNRMINEKEYFPDGLE